MKILVISTSIFKVPTRGYSGLEEIAYLTAKGLAVKGHEVDLVAPEGSHCEGVNIISIGPERALDEKKSFKIYSSKLNSYNVIIDHSWMKYSYLAKMQGLKSPVLGVCHAPVRTMYQSLPPIEKLCFVCISNDQAESFKAIFDQETRVCYNGIDINFYKNIGVPRTNRFLFLARFSSIKGPNIAIQACKEAGVGLDLVGDTQITNEPELYRQCVSMADGEQIRIIGGVSRAETVHWFSKSHCLLHPNKFFREPYGMSPVESMLCGTPVIAWDFGAMRETILPGVSGLLIKNMNELVNQIKQATLPDSFVNKNRDLCRQWAMKFSVQNMVDRYESLCKEAVETGGW